MLVRTLFAEEHEAFRATVRRFIDAEIAPHHARWEHDGQVPRSLWAQAGATGLLGTSIPQDYGGTGADELFGFVVVEELARAGITGPGFAVHNEMVMPYINAFGSEEQKRRWLPAMVRGEVIGALGLTEPQAGSDLKGIRTRAVRDGDHYVIDGQKTFISNGQLCDVIVLACRTDPDAAAAAGGLSLFIVEADRPGFVRGRRLEKLGLKAQDTSELFFQDVKVPVDNLLGGEGRGFICLMEQLPWERLQIAIGAVAAMQSAIDLTLAYVKDRKVFGQPVGAYQNTRYKLAELQSEAQVARVFVDKCTELEVQGKLDSATASMAKYWCSDLQNKIIDECVQLHGGYGYMWEYPVARAWADARVQRIYGGTNEIMKELISRSIGLGGR